MVTARSAPNNQLYSSATSRGFNAVDIEAQEIDLTRESLLGDERIDTLERQTLVPGDDRVPGEAHDDFPDRVIAPVHHQTVPPELAREETGVAAIHPAPEVYK